MEAQPFIDQEAPQGRDINESENRPLQMSDKKH